MTEAGGKDALTIFASYSSMWLDPRLSLSMAPANEKLPPPTVKMFRSNVGQLHRRGTYACWITMLRYIRTWPESLNKAPNTGIPVQRGRRDLFCSDTDAMWNAYIAVVVPLERHRSESRHVRSVYRREPNGLRGSFRQAPHYPAASR